MGDRARQYRSLDRRNFLKTAAGMAFGAGWLAPRVARARTVGPNDKINLAVVGVGGMGSRHVEALVENERCNVAAVCDVYTPRYVAAQDTVEGATGRRPDGYQDYRRILDRNDIDAVMTATPDHWHALITIHGCQAGKDVYVEKPACVTVTEGRAMIDAARRYGRVVQLGTQQRSMPIFHKAMKVVHGGVLGPITTASAWVGTNGAFESEAPADPPEGLDWDLWLGPAPWVPYSPQRFGAFRAWYDYARGGELTNWGVHLLDIVHWGIDEQIPISVQALGGNYRDGAGSDNYETIDALIEYPRCTVTWEQRHSNQHMAMGYGMKFQGPAGQLWVDRSRFVVRPKSLGYDELIGEPEKSWANKDHHNNFFDCIFTRERPAADIEQGVRSTIASLLPGIALKVGRKLEWDGDNERFIDDEAANRHLHRVYRAPWHL